MMSEQPEHMEDTGPHPALPPPLITLDQPNPPNVVISHNSGLPNACSQPTYSHCDPSGFMLSTRQLITASRLCPDLEVTHCANEEEDDVDLDKMYMEAMMEDLKYSVGR